MPAIRCLILALGLLVGTAAAGTRVLPPGAVLVDEATPKADIARLAVDSGDLLARLERGDADAALAKLRAIEDALAFELTAARVIDALAVQPRKAGDLFLAALENEPVRVFHRHEEAAGDWFVPLVDVAARARSARRVLDAGAARERALAALLADAANVTAIDADALAAAIAVLPAAGADALAERVARGELEFAGRALVQLALRSARAPVWMQALERGQEIDVLPLFAAVDAKLSDADALDWLHRAERDPRYRSAAVMATGRMATHSSAAAERFDAYLGRADTGPSAAAALAAHGGAGLLTDIDRRLAKAKDPLRVRYLALALRLADTPDATQRLQALRHDPRLPAAAKAELQR